VVGRHLEPFGLHRGARPVGSKSGSGGWQTSSSRPPCFNPGAVCARCNLGNPRTGRKSGPWNCQSRFSGRAHTVPAFRIRSIDPFGDSAGGIHPGPCNCRAHTSPFLSGIAPRNLAVATGTPYANDPHGSSWTDPEAPERINDFRLVRHSSRVMLAPSLSHVDPEPPSILACPGCRRRGWRHYHLLATSDTARACPHDLVSEVAGDDVAPAFRTCISIDCRGEVKLWTDKGAHHVMKHRKNLQPFGAARRAHRLIPFNLHCGGTPRDIRGVLFNEARRDGPARWRRRRKGRCSACERPR
jgi:hypothetical protein